jgi:hypothetical protein
MRSQTGIKAPYFTLRITVQGLCALVPDQPFFKNQNGKSVPGQVNTLTALLPDAREVGFAYWENRTTPQPLHPYYRTPHVALLRVHPQDIQSSQNFVIDGMIDDPVTGESQTLHILNQEILSFDVNAPVTFEGAVPMDEDQPVPGSDPHLRRSLWWLPRMAEIAPQNAVCPPGVLAAPPDAFGAFNLAAKVNLPGGHLSVSAFNRDGAAYWSFGVITGFDANGNAKVPTLGLTWNRAIGNRLQVEVRIYGPTVELDLAGATAKSAVVLQPRTPGGVVDVLIDNTELENVVLNLGGKSWATKPVPDADFQLYYSLTSAPAAAAGWAVPVSYSDEANSGPLEKPCPMAVLTQG